MLFPVSGKRKVRLESMTRSFWQVITIKSLTPSTQGSLFSLGWSFSWPLNIILNYWVCLHNLIFIRSFSLPWIALVAYHSFASPLYKFKFCYYCLHIQPLPARKFSSAGPGYQRPQHACLQHHPRSFGSWVMCRRSHGPIIPATF